MSKAPSKYSLLTIVFIFATGLLFRTHYLYKENRLQNVTNWDALGYYAYLPGMFVYHDISTMSWLEDVEKEYHLTGGSIYQFRTLPNGNRVGKYFTGISVLQAPWFLVGHSVALMTSYKADGFSAPYQYAIGYGVLVYLLIALFILRSILLKYFDDRTAALTLLIIGLGTNLIQYAAVDGGLSHAYIFLLYTLQLYFTIQWHTRPSVKYAILIGFTLGFTTLCRPTEIIMLFIPLFWSIKDAASWRRKIALLKQYKLHLLYAGAFVLIALLPQLVYWKIVTGNFVYNVGSKWMFFNPWFRVLFGFQKGWFIYTPLTVLFIAGFFFIRNKEFRISVLVFCLANIWIIIAWHDWRYGGSYSTRALVQSYPVFALSLGSLFSQLTQKKIRFIALPIMGYFIVLNLFQMVQYNRQILLNDGMTFAYYKAIYWNLHPTPVEMSLLDTKEYLRSEKHFHEETLVESNSSTIQSKPDSLYYFINTEHTPDSEQDTWIKVEMDLKSNHGAQDSYIVCEFHNKQRQFRLNHPLFRYDQVNHYAFYFRLPNKTEKGQLKCYLKPDVFYEGRTGETKSSKTL